MSSLGGSEDKPADPQRMNDKLIDVWDLGTFDPELAAILAAESSLALPVSLVPAGMLKGGDYMRKTFDRLWMSAGFEDGSLSYRDERWAGYDR